MTISPELISIGALFITMVGGFFYFGVNFGSRLGKLEGRVDGIEKDVLELKVALRELNNSVNNLANQVAMLMGKQMAFGNSPLQLTPAAVELIDEIDGAKVVSENYTSLSHRVFELGATTDYDVQVNAVQSVEEFMQNQDLNQVKKVLFNNGKTLNQVYEALGLLLRDKIFEERIWKNG
ncbi:MAG: hypothetical protein LBQ41_03955 [Candidatus Ancillula sp.]|nr:hypothetical protein [Candidatus Ancillula sp.]